MWYVVAQGHVLLKYLKHSKHKWPIRPIMQNAKKANFLILSFLYTFVLSALFFANTAGG